MKVELDRHELWHFIRTEVNGSHLSQGIWRRIINEFYPKMDEDERGFLVEMMKRNYDEYYGEFVRPEWKEEYDRFLACFGERYLVNYKKGKNKGSLNCYYFHSTYWVDYSRFVPAEILDHVIRIKKKS